VMSGYQGERGDSGERGIAGERGPKGDHGQTGDPGATGATGEAGRNWRWSGGPAMRTLAFLLVVLATAFAVYRVNDAGIASTKRAEFRTCQRVQFLRDQANGTNFLIYDTFKTAIAQQQKAIDSGRVKGAALKQTEDAIKRGQNVVNTTVVTGPTDCVGATYDDNYKAPAPEFVVNNTPRVKAARAHAADIIRKAKLRQPLYDATHEPRP
jgi:hypothetical protein